MYEKIIQEIKEKLDIIEFISNYLELKKIGSYYRGLCPFHQEKNPSFFVSPSKQMFKCFGCGAAGDVVTFYMRIENLEFKEAVNRLAEKLGIDLSSYQKGEPIELEEIKKLLEINKIALNYFKKNLQKKDEVKNYLKNRGLKDETIEYFDLGYAERGSYLRDYLFNLGYSLEDIMEAGLLNDKKEDKFQGRIIFPLIDHKKRLVGFTGRLYIESENAPKYLNSPDTKLFKKSNFIYGLVYSLEYIENSNEVIITEGQFDMILSFQNGLKNVVAVSGSSLTENQLKILKRYCKKITFAFDNDRAGINATIKSGLLALKEGFEVYKLIFHNYKDLAEFFENYNDVENLKRQDLIEYLIDNLAEQYDLENLNSKKAFIDLILSFIKLVDNIKASYYINKLAEVTKVKEDFLIAELNKNIVPIYEYEENIANFDRFNNLIERFLGISYFLDKLDLVEELKNYLDEECINLIDSMIKEKDNIEILKARGNYESLIHEDLIKELEFLKKELLKEYYRKKIKSYKDLIENNKNFNNLEEILKNVKFYTDRLRELEKNA